MAYIESEDFAVVSGSPELLVKERVQNYQRDQLPVHVHVGNRMKKILALANELIIMRRNAQNM